MKASELRMGNWVKINDALFNEYYKDDLKTSQFKIRGFNDSSHIEGSKQILFWEIDSMLGGRTHSGSRDIDCEPIPLTEEWLVSFGFESEGLGYEINDRFLTVISEEDEGFNVLIMTVDFEKPMYITFIEHVHQLQNLYFALMHKELEPMNS